MILYCQAPAATTLFKVERSFISVAEAEFPLQDLSVQQDLGQRNQCSVNTNQKGRHMSQLQLTVRRQVAKRYQKGSLANIWLTEGIMFFK